MIYHDDTIHAIIVGTVCVHGDCSAINNRYVHGITVVHEVVMEPKVCTRVQYAQTAVSVAIRRVRQ